MVRPSKIAGMASGVAIALCLGIQAQAADEAGEAGLERAREALEPYLNLPVFTPPGEPFDARACAEGRRQLSIPNTSSNPFLKGIIDRMKEAGALIGLEVVEWENQGQPSQWVQGVEYAIRENFDIIDLISGVAPETISPQVVAATEAGVRVMTSHFYDPSMEQHPSLSSSLTIGFNEAGTILANWSIVNTEGNARILLIVSDEVPPTGPLVAGIRDTLAANCPDCEIRNEINVGVAEWGTRIQPAVQSALQADPDINVVIPIYDAMSQFVVPALRLTGRLGNILVPTFNGTPFVLDFVREGSVSMEIGESLDWIAYATIDGHVRDLCGLPTPTALNVPFYIFDSSNVEDAGVPAQYDTGYGDAYITGFHQLWGLTD